MDTNSEVGAAADYVINPIDLVMFIYVFMT